VTPRPFSVSRGTAAITALVATLFATPYAAPVRIAWRDVAPVQATLRAGGVTEPTFDTYVARVAADNVRRAEKP